MIKIKCSGCGGENDYNSQGYKCKYCGKRHTPIKFKCKCGADCDYIPYEGYKCKSCGFVNPPIEDEYIEKLNTAIAKRLDEYDFEASLKLCNELLEKFPDNQEALWGALLAEYTVVDREREDGSRAPTFLEPEAVSPIVSSPYYKRMDQCRRVEADLIERVRANVCNQYKMCQSYDVFICYKKRDLDASEKLTPEAELAGNVYKLLDKRRSVDGDSHSKLRVFYADECLDKNNAHWEPHIYKALKTAKVMIVLCSSVKNVNSEWVQNEWMRFVKFNKPIIPVIIGNVDTDGLPSALNRYQAVYAEDKDWQEKLIDRVTSAANIVTPSCLFEEAKSYIVKNKFTKAKKTYEKILAKDRDDAQAFWGLLKCRLRAFDDYDLVQHKKPLSKYSEFNRALENAQAKDKEYFEKVQKAQSEHDANDYNRDNRNLYLKTSKPARIAKAVLSSLAACAVLAFGVYTYFGVTRPISYKIDDGTAVLSGKSIYFNLVVKHLEVDTYNNYPVVKVDDGALKNSGVQSVRLSESVKEIGESAFENCTSLKTVEMANCTYIGANAFKACTNLTDIRIGITDATVIEENAFTDVGKNVTISVPTIAEKVTVKLQAEYPEITFTTYTLDKVEECVYFIAKLSNLTNDSEANIQEAENLYNALSTEKKAQVNNYGILQNARASYNAVAAINAIGTVTLDSGNAITAAENIYGTLTSEQKLAVSNYAELTTARAVYDTMSLIAEIGEVQLNSEPKIIRAEEAYIALSYEQRDLVSNYNNLTTARKEVDILLANAVIEKINAIDSIILVDSESLIAAAEAAYDSLSDAQKSRVSNYDTLTDARAIYNCVKAIDNIGTVTVSSGSTLNIAQTLYNGLTSAQKIRVTNYTDLTDAAAVYPVVVQINTIGNVMPDSLSVIETAEAGYKNLTAIQKTKVSNYISLTNARTVYSLVCDIEAINEVSESNGAQIQNVYSVYNGLSDAQKSIVGNYSKLNDVYSAYLVVVEIDGIEDKITADSEQEISDIEIAYGRLTATQKSMVFNYENLTSSRDVCDVFKAIENIGAITVYSGNSITTAENAYNKLTSAQKRRLSNADELTDATAVYSVVKKIGDINVVMPDSSALFEEIEEEYTCLTIAQQNKVSNYEKLSNARAAYDTVCAIAEITEITENNGRLIEQAETLYEALTNEQKSFVGNYDKLSDALIVYNVVVLINEIGNVSLNSSSKISSAESAYIALNAAQKALIYNYNILITARAIYNLEIIIEDSGTLVLGRGTNYNYKTLNVNNMVSELNNESVRNTVDSVTREGLKFFTEDETNAFADAFPNYYISRYDLTNVTVTSFPDIPKTCTSIGFISNANYTFNGLQLKFDSRFSDINLELINFNIVSPQGKPAIDATDVSSQYTVTLTFVGACSVCGANGSNGTDGAAGKSSLTLSVISGKNGDSGTDGADAISANALSINIETGAVVSLIGGAGGNGGNGGNGASCNVSNDGYAQCGHGGAGGNGGNGGNAINSSSTVISNSGSIDIYGGAGGAGGAGGHGGNNSDTGTDKPDRGGHGGNGGIGGTGGCAVKTNTITVKGNKIKATGGNGSVGGAGGDGGKGHSNTWYPNGTRGGNAGDGGKGGDGGASVSVVCNNATLTAGEAALGGIAGSIGLNAGNPSYNGQPGVSGNKGTDGVR